ncbi:MAG: ribosomal protein S18-alanine N-acetyltransferase [Gammaproteobacteria bacterium]|nr:ribosomal protein S18-alanine N-acetyltransferase [Gammaproteobacteria bacterium]
MLNANIRVMTQADVADVYAVEIAVAATPWSERVFAECLLCGYWTWVVEKAGKVVGFALVSSQIDEAHIMNIAILPDYQGQGLGRMLLKFIIDEAKKSACERVFLEVRKSNEVAIQLYQSCQFNRIGLRHQYYPEEAGQREDALIFELILAD